MPKKFWQKEHSQKFSARINIILNKKLILIVFCFYLLSLCATSQVYYSEASKSISCETNCAEKTKCGDYITIPDEHLDVCGVFFFILSIFYTEV